MPQASGGNGTPLPCSMLELLRSPVYGLIARALILNDVSRFKMSTSQVIQPNYWTFEHEGSDVIVSDVDVDAVKATLTAILGRKVTIKPRTIKGRDLMETLTLDDASREAVQREAFALLTNLSADDLVGLPPVAS